MRFIYSYNSFGGKKILTPFETKLARLSVSSLKRVTGKDVTFYGDISAIQFFVENKIPFDNMFSTKYTYNNPLYWNTGKIETYAHQIDAFLHIDFDVVFIPGFSVPNADIVTEQIRTFEHTEEIQRFGIDSSKIPEKLICSGMIGGTNNTTFYQLHNNLIANENKLIGMPKFDELVSLEEYALTQIVEENKLNVAELDRRFYAHFQGPNKEERFGPIINQLYEMYES